MRDPVIIPALRAHSPAAWARSDSSADRQTLTGLSAVSVLVNEVNPTLSRLGLTKGVLQTDTELRLRAAGIQLVAFEEGDQVPGSPVLLVEVRAYVPINPAGAGRASAHARRSCSVPRASGSTRATAAELVVATIDVRFFQGVELVRDHAIRAVSSTWRSRSYLGNVGQGDVMSLRQRAADLVDQFAKAYLAMNPHN